MTKCNFCPSNTCTSSSISTNCSCHWHQQHQGQQANQQQQTNQHQPVLPVTPAKAPVQQVQSVTVIANQHNDVTEWLLPNHLSQSTIGGRMTGSNACTVMALLTGRHSLEGALAIPKELKDLGQTNPFYSKMIFKGNHIYNAFKLPANQPNLDVQNVLQQNHEEFQKIKIDADRALSILREKTDENFPNGTVQIDERRFYSQPIEFRTWLPGKTKFDEKQVKT